jgi:hypothetical protein
MRLDIKNTVNAGQATQGDHNIAIRKQQYNKQQKSDINALNRATNKTKSIALIDKSD